MTTVDKALAVAHIPSGLFIVCAQGVDGKIDGYLASWVQQVSFNPLLISLAIKPGRPAYDSITAGKIFSVNIVGEQRLFLKYFWKGYDPLLNPFQEIPHRITSSGAVIMEEAKSVLECKFISKVTPGDHEIVMAEVQASHILKESDKTYIHSRKSGLDY